MVDILRPWVLARGSQRDVFYLGWPIAPSYMSPNAREGGRSCGVCSSCSLRFGLHSFFYKGLVAVCHSFCIYLSLDTFTQHSFINIGWGPSPCLHSCRLSGWILHGVPSRDSNSGLPYSKPARYQLSHTALYWATLHPELSHTAPYWATLLTVTLWRYFNCCTQQGFNFLLCISLT